MQCFLLLTCMLFNSLGVPAQEILLEGYYNGINLYVQNPKIGEDKYCITSITINGKLDAPLKQNSSFDIEMAYLEIGAPVEVLIRHHRNCMPKVLNGSVIKKRVPFKFTDLQVTESSIEWASQGERVYGKYFIRRYDKNHWNTIHAMNCKNQDELQQYNYQVCHFSGENKYQIKYLESSGKAYYSEPIEFTAAKKQVSHSYDQMQEKLSFSVKAQYRIMDVSGKVLMQGCANVVDCKKLKKGIYHVAFENQVKQFSKK